MVGVFDQGGRDAAAPVAEFGADCSLFGEVGRHELGNGAFQCAGVGGDADVGEGSGGQDGAAGVGGEAAEAEGVGGIALVAALGAGTTQVGQNGVEQLLVGVKQGAAGGDVLSAQGWQGVQFCGDMKAIGVDDLVAGGFFGVGGEAVVFEGIAGETGDVFDGEVKDGVFGDGGVAVADDPAFVEIGGGCGGDAGGDLVEGIRRPGGHGESDGDLLFGQIPGGEGVDTTVVGRRG